MSALTLRVAARYVFATDANLQPMLKYIVGKDPAIVVLVTAGGGMDVRIYPSKSLSEEEVKALDNYILGVFHGSDIEVFGPCKDAGGAPLAYMTQSAWKHIKEALLGQEWGQMPFKLLLDQRPSSYPDAKRHVIVIDSHGESMIAIKKVLMAIKRLGDIGHSTSVDIDDEPVAYVDGDGSDRIREILVDDEVLEKAASRVLARYKSKKLVDSEDGGKTTVYEYSDRQIAHRNNEKAKRLEKFSKSIGELRRKIKQDLKSRDPEKRLVALATGLIDVTAERVGNSDSASEKKHFGVTGWQRKHVSLKPNAAMIRYIGKSGVKQEKKVSDKALLSALHDAYEAAEDDDSCLFCWDGGQVTAEHVNAYLKPFGISAKDIRGFRANSEIQKRLKTIRSEAGALPEDKKAREKQLKEEFKQALDEVAETIGHESSTLESDYLIPGLKDTFLKDGEVMTKMVEASVVIRYLTGV